MKSLKICFAGLVVLFFVVSCNLRAGQGTGQAQIEPSATPTLTPVVSSTASLTPTRRATLIVFLTSTRGPSVTPKPLVTPIPSDIVLTIQAKITEAKRLTGGGPFGCRLISTRPEILTILRPKEEFSVTWRVLNSGTARWLKNDVALHFISGSKLQTQKYKENFIPYTINPKDPLNLQVPMRAPAEPGVYYAIWGLRTQGLKTFFCSFQVVILVQEK